MPLTSFGKGGKDTDGLDPALRDVVGLALSVDPDVECWADDFEVALAMTEGFCFADVFFADVAGGLVRVGDAADVVVGAPTLPPADELPGSGVVVLRSVVDGFDDVEPTVRESSLFVAGGSEDPARSTVFVGDDDATADDSPRGSTAIATATRAAIATAVSAQRRRRCDATPSSSGLRLLEGIGPARHDVTAVPSSTGKKCGHGASIRYHTVYSPLNGESLDTPTGVTQSNFA